MTTTVEIDEALYRRLAAAAAREGRTVDDLVADGVRLVLNAVPTSAGGGADPPSWFGALRRYAGNAGGAHELEAVRASIEAGRGERS